MSRHRPLTDGLTALLREHGVDACLLCGDRAFLLLFPRCRRRPDCWAAFTPAVRAKFGDAGMRPDRKGIDFILSRVNPPARSPAGGPTRDGPTT